MAIITLTSDWGNNDHYIAAVKGRILGLLPDANIVDISHTIPHFNNNHAAFVLMNAFTSFPEGTVHLIGVNSIAGIHSPHTLVKYRGHYFIGADNGILSLVCGQDAGEIYEIDIPSDTDYFTFPARDTFPKVIAHIFSGRPLSEIGERKKELRKMMQFEPIVTGEQIRGKIIYVDHYRNAFTNISEPVFRTFTKGRTFLISFRSDMNGIKNISNSYDDVPEGEVLALFSTAGYLQIAVNKGKAAELLGLDFDESILVIRDI